MRLNDVCRRVIEDAEGARGCVVVDLATGLPLGHATREGDGEDVAFAAARLATQMFRGRLARQLAIELPTIHDGELREAQVTTRGQHWFMVPVPGWDDCLAVSVTDAAVSVGLGWMALHQACDEIAAAAPPATAPPRTVSTDSPETPPRPPPVVAERIVADRDTSPASQRMRDPARADEAVGPAGPGVSAAKEDDAEPEKGRPGARAFFGSRPR